MSKSHILLWSGGIDSTAILINMVSRPEEYPDVRVIGCGLKNANNYEEDLRARKKIAEILSIPNRNISYAEQELDITTARCSTQLPMWAWLSSINVGGEADTTMVYGFIRGDDFWHSKHEFETAVKNLTATHSSSNITFSYPFEWLTKKEFVSWYLNYSEVFRSLSWGGDTVTIKAKDREELEFLYEEILKSAKMGVKPDIAKQETEITDASNGI